VGGVGLGDGRGLLGEGDRLRQLGPLLLGPVRVPYSAPKRTLVPVCDADHSLSVALLQRVLGGQLG